MILPRCQLDLYCVEEAKVVARWVRATGSLTHVCNLEKHAMSLAGYWSLENELRIGAQELTPKTEQEFYAALGMVRVEPHERL